MSTNPTVQMWSDSLVVQRYWTPVEDPIPARIWSVVDLCYVHPLRALQARTGAMFFPSLRSGFRPISWERSKGRSGSSLHTFPGGSMGAVDLVMWNGEHVRHYVDLLVEFGPWRRIAYYSSKGFVHVDYGHSISGRGSRRQLFEGIGSDGVWSFRSYLAEPRV